MSSTDELRALVGQIEAGIARKIAELARTMPAVDPLDARDANGRPIILDAQIALLAARVALHQADTADAKPTAPASERPIMSNHSGSFATASEWPPVFGFRYGLPRSQQLKAIGNGVVPQQCAAAVCWLLDPATA